MKIWKASKDPAYAAEEGPGEQLHAIADDEVVPRAGEPTVVICVDEFGPLNLQPRPGWRWAAVSGKRAELGREPRPRMRATYARTARAKHLLAAHDMREDKLYGHVRRRKTVTRFLEFVRILRSLYPPHIRIALVMDNSSSI